MNTLVIKALLISLLFAGTYFIGRSNGFDAGETAASNKYAIQMQEYKKSLDDSVTLLNGSLVQLSTSLSKDLSSLNSSTQQIRKDLKTQPKPLVVIQDGKCVISDVTVEARRKMIERVNK